MTIYEPPPERDPLFLRRPPGAGGMLFAILLLVAVLGIPLVFGVCIVIQELAAFAEGPNP